MFSRSGSHKLVLLGDTFVGKSSLVLRFVRDKFNDTMESTVGAAFMTQSVFTNGKTVKFEIWDTAGQERYRSLTPMYYRGAKVALVLYDITSHETFECAKSWIEELNTRATSVEIIALVGNKIDLEDDRTVSHEEGQQYAKQHGMLFFEISVKEAIGVNEVFIEIAEKLPASREGQLEDGADSSCYSSLNNATLDRSLHSSGGHRQNYASPSNNGNNGNSKYSCCLLL